MMFTLLEVFVDYPNPISVTLLLLDKWYFLFQFKFTALGSDVGVGISIAKHLYLNWLMY